MMQLCIILLFNQIKIIKIKERKVIGLYQQVYHLHYCVNKTIIIFISKSMQLANEGFDEPEQHLTSKGILPNQQKQQQSNKNPFFSIPDAKPILSKSMTDMNKPKILIKQFVIYREPIQLILGKSMRESDSIVPGKRLQPKIGQSTIFAKYILSQLYECHYMKFYKGSIRDLQKSGYKKFKLQIQKLCNNNQYVFSNFIVDLSFLNDVGSYLLRNLKQSTLQHKLDLVNSEEHPEVVFDSRFQCGNLHSVFKKTTNTEDQYDLILQTDVNTKGYSNWFYFSVSSKKKKTFKFNIINMQKKHSLYINGMKIAVFSAKKYQNQHIQWHREGYNFTYGANELRKGIDTKDKYHTLSFCLDQKYDNDIIYIAANIPYSYSKMLKFIENIEKIAKLNQHIYFKRQILTKSISSNICPVLTITWKRDKKSQTQKTRKKIIGVIARQHPCQTVSSFVLQGFLNSLVYLNNQYAVELLKNYIFKIVPMINIDGVIYGSSRCDLSGSDINRRWTRNPNNFLYPILYNVKGMFTRLVSEGYDIDYFFDLHGHSKKMGSFIYGCKNFDQLQTKQFSWILSKINTKFLFDQCSFGLSNLKRETARGVMSNVVFHKRALTIQSSFFGYKGIGGTKHFQIKDLQGLGESIIEAVYSQQTRDPKLINWQLMKAELKQYIHVHLTKKQQQSSGSDSEPSADEMNEKQRAQTFLPIQIANKIGLIDVKVNTRISKKQENYNCPKFQQTKKLMLQLESSGDTSNELQSILFHKNYRNSYQTINEQAPKPIFLKQSKSVTKITPFKFTQRSKRSSSDFKQRIRIAIDITSKKPDQKLSSPTLPIVNEDKRNKFWKQFNKQFKSLMSEKQKQMNNAIKSVYTKKRYYK